MPSRRPSARSFQGIRPWDGKQTRAFEELCFQLRDPEPAEVELRKTSDPDGGLEWYWVYPDGTEVGWQCKFSNKETALIQQMDSSFKSAHRRRPKLRKLTFCLSVDLSDDPDRSRGEFGWQRFAKQRTRWREIAPELEVELLLGGVLLERLSEERHRGRDWFWFESVPVLHPEWCRDQRDVAIESVDPRYRPDINVDLPVGTTVTAVGLPESLRLHFDTLITSISLRSTDVGRHSPASGPFAESLFRLAEATERLVRVARDPWAPSGPFLDELAPLLTNAQELTEALLNVSYREAGDASVAVRDKAADDARSRLDRAYRYERKAQSLEASLFELSEWANGPARSAASAGFLLLDGDGGAGKTHLFCHASGQLIDEGHPVLLLLGQWFGGQSPWKTLAERIGGPGLSIEETVVALEASAEASNRRMVLMIDAINDGEPEIWRKHLRELRSRLSRSGWVGVALSCRTTYLPAVEPSEGFGDGIALATHPGFAGREFEAMERIFDAYGVPQPRVPLLLSEFTNPLFLVLYSDSVARGRVPPTGAAHLSAIFTAFVDARKDDIAKTVGLDRALDPVGKALQALIAELIHRRGDYLPYDLASDTVSKLDLSGGRWPNTLFGQMLSEGLITKDYAFLREEGYEGESIRFPYQRFSDHLVVEGLLDAHLDADKPLRSFAVGEPLFEVIAEGQLGLLEAFAVQLPERCSVELPEAVREGDVPEWRSRWILKAFLKSVPLRDPSAADPERILPLLESGIENELVDEAIGAVVACAPISSHPLNGEWLHHYLASQSLPERDSGWTQLTYWAFGETMHPLDRLIRWAERGPYPKYDQTDLELAAIPITWTLASPNRFARDSATKSLTSLLIGRPKLADRLATRFIDCDDPYVTERLAAAAYGALLRIDVRHEDTDSLTALLETLVVLMERTRPNVLLRDHVAGIARYLRDRVHCQIDGALVERALPPYGASEPKAHRTLAQLEEEYPSRGPNDEVGYGSVQHSLFTDFGDFHKYVMSGCVRRFQRQLLSDGSPLDLPPGKRWEGQYPSELAARYIFESVIELGWTPALFADFEMTLRHADRGRDSHKPERFGKKYQWIGLHDLLARLADTHVFTGHWGDEPESYEGAWQLSARDIDPTLPPARVQVIGDERTRGPQFPPDRPDAWWVPEGPVFDRIGGDSGRWAERMDDLPPVAELFRRRDPSGTNWVVLDGRIEYEEPHDGDESPRRDLGLAIHTALVKGRDAGELRSWFDTKADIMRSLPGWDAQAWNDSYFGEVPWAAAAMDLDTGWGVERHGVDLEFPDESLEVSIPWHWPSGFDCSLDEPLNIRLPSPQLQVRGDLRRVADRLAWSVDEEIVLTFRETDEGWNRDWALLAREEWLLGLLERERLVFLAGAFGERRVLGADVHSHEIFGWIDLGAGALLAGGRWSHRGFDVLWDRRSGEDR